MIEQTSKYPVYLVDDDEAVREALQLLLQTTGVTTLTYSDPRTFLSSLDNLAPGCIVLDIRMPAISGLKLQQRLTDLNVNWPTIIISGHGDIDACRRAFTNGAIDFLSKPIDEQDLIDAVQKGFDELESSLSQSALMAESRTLVEQLTKRELSVLEMITRGYSSKECAQALSVSPRTIETHRANLTRKLGTHSVVELARILKEADGFY